MFYVLVTTLVWFALGFVPIFAAYLLLARFGVRRRWVNKTFFLRLGGALGLVLALVYIMRVLFILGSRLI
jgi:hypothetical protein